MKYELKLKTEIHSMNQGPSHSAEIKECEILSDAETAIAKFEQFSNVVGPQIQALRCGETTEVTIFRCAGNPVTLSARDRSFIKCSATVRAKEDSEHCMWYKLKSMKLEVMTPGPTTMAKDESDTDN